MNLSIILQAGCSQGSGGSSAGGGMSMILMMVALFAVMYLFMIRPQQKKQKKIEMERQNLKVGDRIVTSGGIYGKIKEVKTGSFLVQVSEGVTIRFAKTSVFPAGTEGEDVPQNK
jgi:preprotein translocase subunit YajC